MEYGNKSITSEKLYLYQGFNPATADCPPYGNKLDMSLGVVNQRDADLLFLWQMVIEALVSFAFISLINDFTWTLIIFLNLCHVQYKRTEGSEKKEDMLKQIKDKVRHRTHLDGSVKLIGTLLFGPGKGTSILNAVGASGLPLVDDWACLKSAVTQYIYSLFEF